MMKPGLKTRRGIDGNQSHLELRPKSGVFRVFEIKAYLESLDHVALDPLTKSLYIIDPPGDCLSMSVQLRRETGRFYGGAVAEVEATSVEIFNMTRENEAYCRAFARWLLARFDCIVFDDHGCELTDSSRGRPSESNVNRSVESAEPARNLTLRPKTGSFPAREIEAYLESCDFIALDPVSEKLYIMAPPGERLRNSVALRDATGELQGGTTLRVASDSVELIQLLPENIRYCRALAQWLFDRFECRVILNLNTDVTERVRNDARILFPPFLMGPHA